MNSAGVISPQAPHFFSVILHDTLSQGKLGIPKMYVSKYGKDLLSSSTVMLRLPDGAEWQVGLSKSDGRIWMQNGWQEFAQHYCLSYGTFLVFRYAGGCGFEVLIFDLSCTEMKYPCFNNDGGCSRTRGGSPEQVDDDDNEEEEEDEEDSVQVIDLTSDDDHAGRKQQERHFSLKEKAHALRKANGFNSTRPFFKVFMYPSFLSRKYNRMPIPRDFARKLSKNMEHDACLRLANGRRWRVKCHRRNSGTIFSIGWLEFAMDNHLQVGDVCVFELVNLSKLTFEITIYKD